MHAETEKPGLYAESEAAFRFALARAYEKRNEFDAAWQQYMEANKVKRALVSYDPVEIEVRHDRLIKVFTEEFFARIPQVEADAVTPLFIVGMPRSGSTLIEQILASHSAVEGAGELPYVIMMSSAGSKRMDRTQYPEMVAELDDSQLVALGKSYLYHAATHCAAKKPYFTDKMPANFSHVGFIHAILPNAKIIDARRDPLATCVANYRHLFAKGKNQSYDLTELGEYYLQYLRIMDHWDKVIPGAVLRVQYEDVVDDLQSQVMSILDHCGLAFEEACLDFHRNKRPVNTASSEQVRQPIYKSGLDFHENYAGQLDVLREILAPVL
jgi:LPS sulfotransferase NodH